MASSRPDPPGPPRSARSAALALRWLLLAGVFGVSLWRALPVAGQAQPTTWDFKYFYLDARYVWEHGALNPDLSNPDENARRQLPFYLPAVAALLAPLTAAGPIPAALLWALLQAASLGYALRRLAAWCDGDPRPLLLALVVALPALFEAAKFNQLSFPILALVLAGVEGVERGRPGRAGVAFALAAILKLLPAVFLVWLALKRRWAALATAVAALFALGVVPGLLAYGPAATARYHAEWWRFNVEGDSAGSLLNPALREHFVDHRNQSLGAVLARVFWSEHPYPAPWRVGGWSQERCRRVAQGAAALLALALFLAARRRWQRLSTAARRAEAATFALAMYVLAPLLRTYYLVWSLPALVLLALPLFARAPERRPRNGATGSAAHGATGGTATGAPHGGGYPSAALGRAGLVAWVLGMLAWMLPVARDYGVHLWLGVLLGVLLLHGTRPARKSLGSA